MSAAFNTLDHSILLTRLHDMFGISGKAFEWFSSYLSDRFQSVSVNGRVSSQKKHHYGVPQGSVLCPILFALYTQPLHDIISKRKCNHHKFSDDTQLRKSSSQSDFHSLIHDIEQCVDSVGSWMTGIRLKLNNDKTETFLVGCRRRVSVSQDSHLKVGSHDISYKSHVKSVGVYIDVTLSMAKHTDHINRSAYLEIRRISSIRPLLTRKATVQLMCSFVQSFGLLQLFTH